MNRPIKFRAWDKKRRVMRILSSLFFDALRPLINVYTGPYDRMEAAQLLPDECDLLQFTGLLDKNGKEIYEGDIILRHPPSKYATWAIEFSTDEGWGLNEGTASADCEVIGNIYENPEDCGLIEVSVGRPRALKEKCLN